MSKLIKSFFSLLFLISFTASVSAADYNLRMTMNSNDQDEDYDGSIVFKNYVESASNGAISVELFVGTQLCNQPSTRFHSQRQPLAYASAARFPSHLVTVG